MNNDDVREWYLALSEPEKQIFLALVSNDLTIHGRYFGQSVSAQQQSRALIGLNELQHQISSHIAGIGLGRDRYPDEVLWNILAEKATAYGLGAHLKKSLEWARSRNVWEKRE
jgi:hypothetical protein